MPQASFPSEAFPAYPSVALDTPDGWEPRAVAGTVLAVIDDRGPDAFSPNVVVGITRATGGHTLDEASAAVDDYVRRLTDVAPIDSARVDFGGRSWAVAEFAYTTAAIGTVVQIVSVTVVEHGQVADVVRVTGTATPADYETSLPAIRQIIAGARVDD